MIIHLQVIPPRYEVPRRILGSLPHDHDRHVVPGHPRFLEPVNVRWPEKKTDRSSLNSGRSHVRLGWTELTIERVLQVVEIAQQRVRVVFSGEEHPATRSREERLTAFLAQRFARSESTATQKKTRFHAQTEHLFVKSKSIYNRLPN
jgi:hypothetical protein